ncbi:hypothetical protein VF13_40375, partial [Nostoc linckia z16]
YLFAPLHFVCSAQDVRAAYEPKVQDIHGFFVCLVTEYVIAYPLYWMKDHQQQQENKKINYRQRIRKYLLHGVIEKFA